MKLRLILATLLAFFVVNAFAKDPVAKEGEKIFTQRCQSCHAIDKVFVGPALGGVENRHDIDWIVKFVHSSQTVIKSGDSAATALFAKFNSITMPDQADLSPDDIKNIVAYIKEQNSTAKTAAPFARPATPRIAAAPLKFSDAAFFGAYTAVVALLVASLLLYAKVKEYERTRQWT